MQVTLARRDYVTMAPTCLIPSLTEIPKGRIGPQRTQRTQRSANLIRLSFAFFASFADKKLLADSLACWSPPQRSDS